MNLLPPYQEKAIREEVMAKFYAVVLGIVSFWALLFLIFLYNSLLYINLQIPAVEERLRIEQETQKANIVQSVENEINDLNSALAKIERIREQETLNFPYILRVIGHIVPPGAELGSVIFQKGNISMAGHADDRSQVLEIKDRLEKEDIFTGVNSPLSNIVKERDITFNFTFSVHE